MSATATAEAIRLADLADPRRHAALLRRSATDEVFLTPEWQRAWWASFGEGELVPILVERDGEPVAYAPFFVSGGMAFLVGSGGSDYLDVVGESTPEVLGAILGLLAREVPGLAGVRLYHVPDLSPTGPAAAVAAAGRGWRWHDEGSLAAPAVRGARKAEAAAAKRSLRRHERGLARERPLSVTFMRDGEIARHLDAFFEQHVRRWEATPFPSLFTDPTQRAFYARLTDAAAAAGWLHFARVDWGGEPVAFHYGFAYGRSLLWYKPSFAIEHARRSPGEVLLRRLLLEGAGLGLTDFDFGLGEEAFKDRFATHRRVVRTWGLYPA
jgi:CelD/BcsL family acetyltransferase involved in cellulose biosynthesis